MPLISLSPKIITGFLAVLFLLNINIFSPFKHEIKVQIHQHQDGFDYVDFYGNIEINNENLFLIVRVEDNEKTINHNKKEDKKEDKKEERTNIKDDKTPGSFKITIQNKKGEKIDINKDYGSGRKSQFDQECEEKIINEVLDYINGMKDKSLKSRLFNTVTKFKNYCNK